VPAARAGSGALAETVHLSQRGRIAVYNAVILSWLGLAVFAVVKLANV
jgi:hypothetical protein